MKVLATVAALALWIASAKGMASAAPNPTIACASAKLRAAGRLNSGLMICFARTLGADACCFSRAISRFKKAFEDAEAAGGCNTTGDAATIATAAVDAANQLVASYIPGCAIQTAVNAGPSCVAGTPASCGGSCVLGHADTFRCSPAYFCACE